MVCLNGKKVFKSLTHKATQNKDTHAELQQQQQQQLLNNKMTQPNDLIKINNSDFNSYSSYHNQFSHI